MIEEIALYPSISDLKKSIKNRVSFILERKFKKDYIFIFAYDDVSFYSVHLLVCDVSKQPIRCITRSYSYEEAVTLFSYDDEADIETLKEKYSYSDFVVIGNRLFFIAEIESEVSTMYRKLQKGVTSNATRED